MDRCPSNLGIWEFQEFGSLGIWGIWELGNSRSFRSLGIKGIHKLSNVENLGIQELYPYEDDEIAWWSTCKILDM